MGAMPSQITSLTVVYSTVYSGANQSKHQSSASMAFVWGFHRGPVNSPHKWPVTRKMLPFDDVIMKTHLRTNFNDGLVNHSAQAKAWMSYNISHKLIGVMTYPHPSMMTSSNGKKCPRYWPFVRGIHRSPVNSPHKGQWRGALMFSLICTQINGWVNNGEAGDLRRHRAHCDVIVMASQSYVFWHR